MIEARKTDVWSHLTKFDRLICMERHVARFPRPVLCGSLVDFNMSVVSASPTYFSVPLAALSLFRLPAPRPLNFSVPTHSLPSKTLAQSASASFKASGLDFERLPQSVRPTSIVCYLSIPNRLGKRFIPEKERRARSAVPRQRDLVREKGKLKAFSEHPWGCWGQLWGVFWQQGTPGTPISLSGFPSSVWI